MFTLHRLSLVLVASNGRSTFPFVFREVNKIIIVLLNRSYRSTRIKASVKIDTRLSGNQNDATPSTLEYYFLTLFGTRMIVAAFPHSSVTCSSNKNTEKMIELIKDKLESGKSLNLFIINKFWNCSTLKARTREIELCFTIHVNFAGKKNFTTFLDDSLNRWSETRVVYDD